MEWKSWASLPLTQREQLPRQPGIYIVVDAEEQIWYVGKSVNLNARWNGKGHHRYKQLSRTNNKRSYRIHWQTFPANQLSEKEQQYIDLFKPHLNYSQVKTYVKKAIQPNEEISRLFKVLNKKTMLFPDIRSVVLGFYKEIDEDGEASLEEYICIVVAVNLSDHDGSILNSCKKSLSRKGNSLKGCWKLYKSDCGVDDPARQPVTIHVFISGNIVYEFVCCFNLIEKLKEHRSNLHYIEIANQRVLALRDTNILYSLTVHDGHFDFRSEDYLRYRAPDLRSVLQLMPEISGA
ncbi:MAG: GIY-YIG nuclease family protein [Oscillatoriales cyanobacterium RM2_1_1]|nr:GIY-YIG nuclease family protein [Oscillatoriales cyanobacterium SM2_3_0]NJO48015.1 GIY-YIG nuclease family protein [Oscillatoriales cyanobacterium RM2_1_1]